MKTFFAKAWAWILGNKVISIVIASVLVVGITCAIVLPIALSNNNPGEQLPDPQETTATVEDTDPETIGETIKSETTETKTETETETETETKRPKTINLLVFIVLTPFTQLLYYLLRFLV